MSAPYRVLGAARALNTVVDAHKQDSRNVVAVKCYWYFFSH